MDKAFAINEFQRKWEKESKEANKEIRCEEIDFEDRRYRVKFVSHEGELTIPNIPLEWIIDEPNRIRSLMKKIGRQIRKSRK